MSDPEIPQIDDDQLELMLRAQLAAVQARKAERAVAERLAQEEEKKKKEAEKPVGLKVDALVSGTLVISGDYREDLLALLRATPGRSWNSFTKKNAIPLAAWPIFEEAALKLPNLSITWETGVKEDVEWWTTAPPWEVIVHPSRRHFILKSGPKVNSYGTFYTIPGSDWDESSKSWKLPLSEGWRVWKILEKIEGVVYEDAAREIIFGQVERRAKLDLVAKKMESPEFSMFFDENGVKMMRGFQEAGNEFMNVAGGRVILGDATGLGKTWQFIAFVEYQRRLNPNYLAIVSVNASNIPNWVREIRRLAKEEPLVLKGGKPDYFLHIIPLMNRTVHYAIISHDTLGTYQVVKEEVPTGEGQKPITKETQVYTWTGIFQAAKPDLFGVDEAHKIKNPDAHRSKAARQMARTPHVICMTATPVMNRTEELWPLLYMMDPDMFKVHDQFNNTYTWGGKRARNVEELRDLMRPMFLRRTKKDVLKDLPPINRMIRYHDLTEDAAERYQKALKGTYEQIETFSRENAGQEMSIVSKLALITRLVQVCAADKVPYTVEIATDLIDEAEDHQKVLIFTHFKATAYEIARLLGSEAVCTVKHTPNAAEEFTTMEAGERDALFEATRRDPRVRYLVTTEAAREGLNLEFCDWVIFNEQYWTPGAHDQCEGRAYGRLADPHAIDSFYVVADVEIERWWMELLQVKIQIIQETTDGVESSRIASESLVHELFERLKSHMWGRGK